MSKFTGQSDEFELGEILTAVVRNWWVLLLCSILSLSLIAWYIVEGATPEYKASTRFELLESNDGSTNLGAAAGLATLAGIGIIETASEADTIIDRVLSRPFIESIFHEGDFLNDPVFNTQLADPSFLDGLKKRFLNDAKESNRSKDDFLVEVIGTLSERMNVIPGENGIIELTIKHPDRTRAALLANVIVDRTLKDIFERERYEIRRSLSYFSDELLRVRADLDAASSALRDYAIGNSLQSPADLAQSSAQLSLVRRQIEFVDESLQALSAIETEGLDGSSIAERFPVVLNLSFRRLLNLSGDPSEWNLPSKERLEAAGSSLAIQRDELTQSFDALEKRAKSSGAAALELRALEREVEVQKAIYESVITQFESRSLFSGYERASGRIVESAIPPLEPSWPKKGILLPLGLILGVILGVSIVLYRVVFVGIVFNLSTVQKMFEQKHIHRLDSKQKKKLELSLKTLAQPAASLELADCLKETNRIVSFFSLGSGRFGSLLALSLCRAKAINKQDVALLDLSADTLEALDGKKLELHDDSIKKYATGFGIDVFYLANESDVTDLNSFKRVVRQLAGSYKMLMIVCSEKSSGLACNRFLMSESDAAYVLIELRKTTRTSIEGTRSLLSNSSIPEPILIVG